MQQCICMPIFGRRIYKICKKLLSYRPVFVIIISVPKSWNLSHNSFVSRWQWTDNNSSQLHFPFISTFLWDFELFFDEHRLVGAGGMDSTPAPGELTPGENRSPPALQVSSSSSLTLTGVSTEEETLLSSSQMSISFSQSLSEKSSVSEPRWDRDSLEVLKILRWLWWWLLLLRLWL